MNILATICSVIFVKAILIFHEGKISVVLNYFEGILILVKLFKIKHQGSYTIFSCREIRE